MKLGKTLIFSFLTVAVLQTQALAAAGNEQEILAGKAQRSVPQHQEIDEGESGDPSGEGTRIVSDSEPIAFDEAEWQQEILAGKAQRSIPARSREHLDEEKTKESSKVAANSPQEKKEPIVKESKNKKNTAPELSPQADNEAEKVQDAQEVKKDSPKKAVKEQKAPKARTDVEREILSGKAQRSTGF